jgi:hypothetical protein
MADIDTVGDFVHSFVSRHCDSQRVDSNGLIVEVKNIFSTALHQQITQHFGELV